jgi:molybdopterin synthase catalytic subunit
MATVRVQREPFDAGAEAALLGGGRRDIGAIVSFTGLCRDDAGALSALEIEYYPGMAEAEIARAVDEAENRWPLLGVTTIHRYGRIGVGEPIVCVVVASAHRREAFEAAEMLMDFLKTRAPFWKRAIRADPDIDACDAAETERADDDPADHRADDPEDEVHQDPGSGLVDEKASEPSCDQPENDPANHAHIPSLLRHARLSVRRSSRDCCPLRGGGLLRDGRGKRKPVVSFGIQSAAASRTAR